MTAAVKALAVLGVLGLGGVGVWAVKDYFGDNMLSKYDYAMINFLQKDNTDIVFEVKKGENADQDLTANDITFTNGQPEKVTVSAVVQVTANSQTSFKKGSSTASIDDTEMAEIKALNGGNWTWKCKLTFTRGDEKTAQNIKSTYKDRIYKDQDKGLFGILKKDLSNYTNPTGDAGNKWTKEDLKHVKMKFISFCGVMRLPAKNKEINSKESMPEVTSEPFTAFTFKKESDSSNDLVPDSISMNLFNRWFDSSYATKEYNTTSSG